MKECPRCHTSVDVTSTECPKCGHQFEETVITVEQRRPTPPKVPGSTIGIPPHSAYNPYTPTPRKKGNVVAMWFGGCLIAVILLGILVGIGLVIGFGMMDDDNVDIVKSDTTQIVNLDGPLRDNTTVELTGVMDGRYNMHMTLRMAGSAVNGSYYYLGDPARVFKIVGTRQKRQSTMTLSEYDNNNRQLVRINAVISSDGQTLKGSYTDTATGATMKFELKVIDEMEM